MTANWGPFDLSGRGVGITGGSGHLGQAMARVAAEAGATVLILGRTEPALEKVAQECAGLRGRVIPFAADITRDADLDRALDALLHEAGGVHGWVNNAYSGSGGRLLEYSREQVTATLSSLTDVMMVTQRVAQFVIARGGPCSMVNISSIYGMVSPYPDVYRDHPEWHNPAAYGAAKAALIQFTRYAATHLAEHGIRVNAVTPGPFPGQDVQKNQLFVKRLIERSPIGRLGHREEVAGAITFLLSDAASYMTGSNIVIDGGWTAW